MNPPVAIEDWIRLGEDGRGWLAMAAADHPTVGSPTKVRFKAISCEGERLVDLWDIDNFCDQLGEVHRSFSGTARLGALEGDFELIFRPVGSLGHLVADVAVSERLGGPVEFELKFSLHIDQSHIPAFASGLRTLHQVSK